MRNGNRMKPHFSRWVLRALFIIPALMPVAACTHAPAGAPVPAARLLYLDGIEKDINSFVPDGRYPDDPFVLVTVQEAMMGARERNGGIGACKAGPPGA